MHEWTDFFIAAAGASGALAGLVIVALSVNIDPILKYSHLPSRAAAAIGTLILVLVCSMAGLIPQVTRAFGGEILAFSFCAWLLQLRSMTREVQAQALYNRPKHEALAEAITGQIQVVPFIIAAILLLLGKADGIYWMAAGTLLIFIFSVQNAWVLLIEILR